MHRLGTQHCVAMGSPPIPGRSVRSAPDTASMTEPLVIDLRHLDIRKKSRSEVGMRYGDAAAGFTSPSPGRQAFQ